MNRNNIPAYELLKEELVGDIQSRGYLLCHKKSGARIMILENEDENKVFNITFRTPPTDSTGVAHILEHSVLCGSKEFSLKDPFVELAKGSLNTFLNAMTFPDKTMYPVASCNDQDFQNLMHVYLDAVFFPNIYEKEEIFRQEGWSYQLEERQGELKYNGVVYNEMKGVFSSPDELLERGTMNLLYPDTPYGVESGGDPLHIPELTYEQFLDFHRSYYHPSNSYIYLYGNMDVEEKLRFIDEAYLSRFKPREIHSKIPLQKAFTAPKQVQFSYPVLENESLDKNTYLSYNAVMGNSLDIKLSVALQVLDYALLSAPGAPLRQALLDAGIGKDIYGGYDDGIYQPYFSLVAKQADPDDMEQFLQVINHTLQSICEKGVDEKSLEAGINFLEFRFREADYSSYPKGLMYGIDIFGSWLYDENQPFAQLKLLDIFKELQQEIGTGYYERLIRTYFIENTHKAYLTLSPQKGLGAEREQETAEKLKAYRESLSDKQLDELVQRTKELALYQEAEEPKEAIACIPMLSRGDIERDAEKLYNRECYVEDTLLLHHDVETNGIGYWYLYFDLQQIPQEQIPYVGILKAVLGYVDTEHYTYGQLFNEINADTGGIQCGTEFFQRSDSVEDYRAFFSIRAKALNHKSGFVFRMIREILKTSRLDDDKRLYEIIARLKSRLQTGIPSAGHSSAVQRAMAYSSACGWMQELCGGIAFYQFLEHLEKNYEEEKELLKRSLKNLMGMLFYKENLTVSFTGDQRTCEETADEVRTLKAQLFEAPKLGKSSSLSSCPFGNEGFMTAGQVQYVAQTGNFKDAGLEYSGALQILKVILSYDYLWMNLRVKGGAYGCMSGFKRNGETYFVSYRDPNLKNTLEVYQGIPPYVADFQANEREMTKYILGTISNLDVPKSPSMKGKASTAAYFMGISQEELQKERLQVLDAAAEDIQKLAPLIEAVLQEQKLCVIGGEDVITREKDVFGEIKHLIS